MSHGEHDLSMRTNRAARHRAIIQPILALMGALILCAYGVIAAMSQDPYWFFGGASLPDPVQIIIRVDGKETMLKPDSPDYDLVLTASRSALSSFSNLSPRTAGLSEATLEDYQTEGIQLEMYFPEPVDFHLPFNDGEPTALIIPIEGIHAGKGYVFRGKDGEWWAGQMVMQDPQPLLDALSSLGVIQP